MSITYLYSLADLTVSIAPPSSIVVGSNASFGVQVSNIGDGATINTITVTVPVPVGLIVLGASGDGFTCTTANQTVTCTHQGPLASGASLPSISINTLVTSAALPSVTFSASVDTQGDNNENNDSATLSNASVTIPPESSGGGGGNGGGGGGTTGGDSGGNSGGESGGGGGIGGTQENSLTFSNELGGFGGPDTDAYNCPLDDEHRLALAIDSNTSCFSFHPDRPVTFTDIEDDPYRNVIEALRKTKIVEHGDFIVSGSGNHSSGKQQEKYREGEFPFEPNRGSSRLEVIKLALLSNCLPIKTGATQTGRNFKDVLDGEGSDLDTFTAEVVYSASEFAIVKGFEDGTVRPFDQSSNAETLAFFLRAANALPEGYSFVTKEHWFDDYVNFAVANRIVSQDFDPFGTMTRSEMSNMLISIMAINPNPAVFSYMQQLDLDSQEFRSQEYAYTPTPLVGSMIVEEESTCNERDPNIVPCLAYNLDRTGVRISLPDHHWAQPYVSALQRTFLGTTMDYMIPDRGVAAELPATREDIVHMALIGNCNPKNDIISDDTAPFRDLAKDNDSELSRLFYTAAEHNIVRGYNDGTVRPDEAVNRLEALAILLRASKAIPDGYKPKPLPFKDLKDGEWYHPYVSFAVGNNIIQKTENYRPDQPMLRTELSALVVRTMRFSNDVRIRAYMTSIDPLLR